MFLRVYYFVLAIFLEELNNLLEVRMRFSKLPLRIRLRWSSAGRVLTGSKKGSEKEKSCVEDVLRRIFVELEGFEPSSKQGTSELSTCLFQPWLSGATKTWTTKQRLILWEFIWASRHTPDYFRFTCTTGSSVSEQRPWGDVLSDAPWRPIKPVIYCTSIRQQERS